MSEYGNEYEYPGLNFLICKMSTIIPYIFMYVYSK